MSTEVEVKIYDIGDDVRCRASFTDFETGDAVDPVTVIFTVKPPTGSNIVGEYPGPTTPQPARVGTGVYYLDVDATMQGAWHWDVYGTGAAKAAGQDTFHVRHKATT